MTTDIKGVVALVTCEKCQYGAETWIDTDSRQVVHKQCDYCKGTGQRSIPITLAELALAMKEAATPCFMGIEGATFEDVWSDADTGKVK